MIHGTLLFGAAQAVLVPLSSFRAVVSNLRPRGQNWPNKDPKALENVGITFERLPAFSGVLHHFLLIRTSHIAFHSIST